jgi:hypothetical protein
MAGSVLLLENMDLAGISWVVPSAGRLLGHTVLGDSSCRGEGGGEREVGGGGSNGEKREERQETHSRKGLPDLHIMTGFRGGSATGLVTSGMRELKFRISVRRS